MLKYFDSIKELLAYYFMMLIMAGLAFAVVEHRSLWDGLWWAIVTATTTGYGDISPVTFWGRTIGAALMHLSLLFFLPLLIGHICARCIKDHDEFTHQEQEELKKELAELKQIVKSLDQRL